MIAYGLLASVIPRIRRDASIRMSPPLNRKPERGTDCTPMPTTARNAARPRSISSAWGREAKKVVPSDDQEIHRGMIVAGRSSTTMEGRAVVWLVLTGITAGVE